MTAALQAALQAETGALERFASLLQDEALVLQQGADPFALGRLAQDKMACATQLQQAAGLRNQALIEQGFEPDQPGLRACAQRHAALAGTIDALLQACQAARQKNLEHGHIIHTLMQYNQSALDTLRHLVGDSSLYDARGRMRGGPGRPQGARGITHIRTFS